MMFHFFSIANVVALVVTMYCIYLYYYLTIAFGECVLTKTVTCFYMNDEINGLAKCHLRI